MNSFSSRSFITLLLSTLYACGGDDSPVEPVFEGDLIINEFMAKNRFTLKDEAGIPNDWVEIYNKTDSELSLKGWTLANGINVEDKVTITNDVKVPANGYVVLYLDGDGTASEKHIALLINRDGGVLRLLNPDDELVNDIQFGKQASDFSASRSPDGSNEWTIEWDVTPGVSNPDGAGEIVNNLGQETVPEVGDISQEILGEDAVSEFSLELSEASMASLRTTPREYVEGSLTFRGRTFSPIGVRLKGQNSFLPIDEKPSFRLEMDTYVTGGELFGLDDLTLNNMKDDPTMMHERMAYKVARDAGVMAPRASHAFITLNNVAYGLYSNIEHVEPRMVSRWFDDATGSLYEATDVDIVSTPFMNPDGPGMIGAVADFEHKSGPDDRSNLLALADDLTLTPAAAMAAAADHVDIVSFKRYWAIMGVVLQFDGFPFSFDDYYIYQNPADNLIHFIPWGMDESFDPGELDRWPLAGEAILPDHCQNDDPCRLSIRDQMVAAVVDAQNSGWLTEFDRVQSLIADWVVQDNRRPYTQMQTLDAQVEMRDLLENRATLLEASLNL